jgi:hypothetical protein
MDICDEMTCGLAFTMQREPASWFAGHAARGAEGIEVYEQRAGAV